ncbi:NAD(P)H oxidoreductase [Yinghuangia soli]|uniref:NAD(P)H oxidoreductase n=1 Tax=Yinghuangia soli TaxID=2908204 RepID=A0AA41Q7E8_9ACTN|nr:NAD(P)H oxidoreductase [Yinghuangia soli]MCF2532898.1 NAD(P)H oxidoreductase [Yinghuangia soli]
MTATDEAKTGRVLLVVAHPRTDALTAAVARQTAERLAAAGHEVDVLDLYAEDFDPRLGPEDEPDWSDRDKRYSAEVRSHQRRIDAADTIVAVFPVWWFGLPAVLKGWVDRVWGYGFAYGRSRPRLGRKRMLWVGLAGYDRDHFAAKGWDDVLDRTLRVGISEFCGIRDAAVRLIHDTQASGPRVLAEADVAVAEFMGITAAV